MMEISGNTVLITGGATGIGFALAKDFSNAENKVIICGRRANKLQEAAQKIPGLVTKVCDISKPSERESLYKWIASEFDDLNILVNNAGIQQSLDFKKGTEVIVREESEIEVNLVAQVDLCAYFVPLFMKKHESAIINVTSGLGFVPMANFPIYCATKAAMHSFCMSLRQQLKSTNVKVFEAIPPMVHDTELKGKPMEPNERSISSSDMAAAVMKGLAEDKYEIAAGPSSGWLNASKSELDDAFKRMNSRIEF